jgi:uncharacterized protein YkwD
VISGFPNGTVQPEGRVTREQFIKMLTAGLGVCYTNPLSLEFADNIGWSKDNINTAIFLDIIKEEEESNISGKYYFNPVMGITREVMAMYLVRALGIKKPDTYNLNFKDVKDININNAPYVAAAVLKGLLKGYPDGTFKPKDILTRAEAFVVIDRYLKEIKLITRSDRGLFKIMVGDSSIHVIETLGYPNRIDETDLGFYWWIYNSNYNRYLQVGISEGRVVGVFSNSKDLAFDGLKVGSSISEIQNKFTVPQEIKFNLEGINFTIKNDSYGGRLLSVKENTAMIFYLDQHKGNTLTGVRILETEFLIKQNLFGYSANYFNNNTSNLLKFTPRKSKNLLTNKGYEMQVLDLTNAIRNRYNLNLISLDERISEVARSHSTDMKNNGFFSHHSPTTGSPFDRLNKGDINYRYAGENIAFGYNDAIDAHEGWMNSTTGHREAILNQHYKRTGIGIVGELGNNQGRYYTVKFTD